MIRALAAVVVAVPLLTALLASVAPRGVGEEDKRKFQKASSYMVRLDDLVACYKCRKRFELTGQSTVLINDNLGDPNADPENFGNR